MYSSSVGQQALLLHVSCSALSVAHRPALLIGLKPALLLGFSLVVAVRPAIIQRTSVIAEYIDNSAFVPKLNSDGVALPEEWFGLNLVEGEDSAEEMDSSDEGEQEEDEDGEDATPDGGAAGQP